MSYQPPFIITTEIIDLISAVSEQVGFVQRDMSSVKPILKTLVAFANTAGGTLVIGRADDGEIIGVDDVLANEERLANLIADSIAPAMMPDIEAVTVDDKHLLLVRVAHWVGPFYLLEKGAVHGAFDQLPCSGATADDLDGSIIRRWFADKDHVIDAAAQESLGLLVRHGSGCVPSNGGLILFGHEGIRKGCFPDARVSCARFLATDKTEFLDRQDIPSLLDAVLDVPHFIVRNTRLASKIEGMQRRDIAEYPAIAIREVLINALAHADYSRSGMRIMVSVFSDRLEIQSQGTLPFGMTLDDFKAGVSSVRNIVISRVLHELGLMEQWGSGYQRIVSACRKDGYPEPEWQELASCVRVIFHPHPDVPTNVGANVGANDAQWNERQLWFVQQLMAGVDVKSEDLKEHWGITTRTAERDIAELRQKEVIEFVGSAKTGRYQLKGKQ